MARKIARGEGADGFFLKTLTECIGKLGAINPDKASALREMFHAEILKNPKAIEGIQEYMRHEGTILERLFTSKSVAVPAPMPDKPKESIIVPAVEDISFGDFDLEPEPENPWTREDRTEGRALANCLNEWAQSRKHPFVQTIQIDGKKYTVIGTAVVHGQNGATININCTTGNFKKLREADESVLVYVGGRPVSLSRDVPNGTAFFVWLCHFKPGRVFRFWMNRSEGGTRKDDPRGSFRILICDDGVGGWRRVAA